MKTKTRLANGVEETPSSNEDKRTKAASACYIQAERQAIVFFSVVVRAL